MISLFLGLMAHNVHAEPPMAPTLVGVIGRNGTRACPERAFENTFHGIGWRAGWVPLPGSDALVSEHHGQLLQLVGRPTSAPPPPALPAGYSAMNCPMAQMRSDMVETPDGIAYQRGIEPTLAAFQVDGVEPFTGLTAIQDADGVTVRLENTLGVPLRKVLVRAHYEGCFGKPSTTESDARVDRLAPGASLELKAPFHLQNDDPSPRKGGTAKNFRLAAILVAAEGDDAWVTIDVAPRKLGITVPDCPR